jgi:ubiquinone/menaquinone biosynthesis C-methylase UbiE
MVGVRREQLRGVAYQAIWGRAFATAYNTGFALAEWQGLTEIRRGLVGRARGHVLELGAGTGLNIEHYPASLPEVVLTEPNIHMLAKLQGRVARTSEQMLVVSAEAEDLPVPDESVDTVVSTLVLCTVKDPRRTLAEVARVLRPGGAFLFAEHVRSDSIRMAGWQARMNSAWSWYACGCQCDRDTLSTIRESPLHVTELSNERLHWISPLIRPLVVGVAATSGKRTKSTVNT